MFLLFAFLSSVTTLILYSGQFSQPENLLIIQNERILPPPNCQYLGRGYDIYFGSSYFLFFLSDLENDSDPLERGVDPGFRQPIFSIEAVPSTNPVDWGYLLPEGVFATSVESCEVSFITHVVESMSHYSSMMSLGVGIDATFEKSSGTRTKSGSFSMSMGFQEFEQSTTMSNMKYVFNTASCKVYKAWMKKYDHPPLDPAFIKAVESLPSVFSTEDKLSLVRYMDFIKTYGTHVVEYVEMGSRLVYISAFSSVSWSYLRSNNFDISVAGSFAMNGETKSGSLSGNVNYAEQQTAANEFMQQTSTYDTFSLGARPSADGDALKWAADSRLNPMPLYYRIVPLDEYSYIHDNKTHYLIEDEIKRKSIEEAIEVSLDLINVLEIARDTQSSQELAVTKYECDLTNSIVYRGKCIKYFYDMRTWYAANDACDEWGGNLVTYRDEEEVRWVKNELSSAIHWIGYNDFETANVYRLPNGKIADFTYWNTGEPTNMANEECAQTNAYTALWNDNYCFELSSYVCERLYVGEEHEKKATSDCDDGVVYDNSTCVKSFFGSENWYEARFKCKEWDLNADLVSIMTLEKNNFLISYGIISGVQQFWIGLSDHLKNLAWKWVGNGKYIVYQNNEGAWVTNYCVYMNIPVFGGRWPSFDCNAVNVGGFMCEKPYVA